MTDVRHATWYFDVVSPFAWLQWRRLMREACDAPHASGLKIEPRPILFAAVLDHVGQKGPAEIPTKRTFTYQFTLWRARTLGVPLRFPPGHPFNPLAALRLAIAAGCTRAALDAVFEHIWLHGRLGDSAANLAPLAATLGIADIATAIADTGVKQRLRENTASAIADGVFGIPTVVIDGQRFWGDDATPMLLDYLAGRLDFAESEMQRIESLPIVANRG